ncbi:MAG: recombinase family protein, partial [Phototrophicaceae bacterium]
PKPQAGWAVYLRTSSDEKQKPELSRSRQRYTIEKNVLDHSDMPVYHEYVDVLTGTTAHRAGYQQLLEDARAGKFSHVIVERADRFGRNDTEALRAIDELDDFGVAVRFANQPDLNPIDPDDRVLVALTFTLARRESALLGLRVRGGVRAKREQGGYHGMPPDGYINMNGQVTGLAQKLNGRFTSWIEIVPERAKIIRYAWDLLLTDKYTLEEICEELHKMGYRYKSGRPFIKIDKNGKRKANYSTLSRIFHNWTYAGWVTSKKNNVLPKTIRGKWEAIVSTEEFEQGIAILEKRNEGKVQKRRHEYLLRGLVFYKHPENKTMIRLIGSTSNPSRPSGGTSYYGVARSSINFLCREIDQAVAIELTKIHIDSNLIPIIRSVYNNDLSEKMGHLDPDEKTRLELALKAIDDEEGRTARLYAAGKITEAIWDTLWHEWQDKRNLIRQSLQSLQQKRKVHIENLDSALEIISKIKTVYNKLSNDDKYELLRQMVERVVVTQDGNTKLELRTPFSYLNGITNEVRKHSEISSSNDESKTTNLKVDRLKSECSTQIPSCRAGGT